jgi:hypothetical protein
MMNPLFETKPAMIFVPIEEKPGRVIPQDINYFYRHTRMADGCVIFGPYPVPDDKPGESIADNCLLVV